MFITFLQMGLANGVQPLWDTILDQEIGSVFQKIAAYTRKCCVIIGVLATLLFLCSADRS